MEYLFADAGFISLNRDEASRYVHRRCRLLKGAFPIGGSVCPIQEIEFHPSNGPDHVEISSDSSIRDTKPIDALLIADYVLSTRLLPSVC